MLEPHLELGGPWVLAMGGTKKVLIGYDQVDSRMYVRLPTAHGTIAPVTKLAELQVAVREEGSVAALEISTRSPAFFREFHRFAGLLTEVFETPRQNAVQAFQLALERWQEFAANRRVLTPEQQLGLLGELLLLEGIIEHRGPDGIETWTGRDPRLAERHDFRLPSADIEVKSTRGASREHFIHGLQQLVPVSDRLLYLLSLRFEAAGLGPGTSLRDQVESVRATLAQHPTPAASLSTRLQAAGFDDADAYLYADRFRLADSPRLIAVDDYCPRIVPSMIARAMPPSLAARIANVTYSLDLDGLGVSQGSPEYGEILGGIKIG